MKNQVEYDDYEISVDNNIKDCLKKMFHVENQRYSGDENSGHEQWHVCQSSQRGHPAFVLGISTNS